MAFLQRNQFSEFETSLETTRTSLNRKVERMTRFRTKTFKCGAMIAATSAALVYVSFQISLKEKYPRVCEPNYQPPLMDEEMRKSVERTVLRQFPWAEISKFGRPSSAKVVLDGRDEAVSRKGYFTIGFDNFKRNTSVPSGYDFYVRYSSDHFGSHFYLKPNAIRLGIQGCKRRVKFIYRDHDIVLQPWVRDGFMNRRITIQQEFHNRSVNAGLIMASSSTKTRQMMTAWEAGAGLAENVEQDQTVLRALFLESDKQFFSAAPNLYAVHIYSGVVNREGALGTMRLKYSASFQQLKIFWLCVLLCCCIRHVVFVLRCGRHKCVGQVSLLARLLLKIGPGGLTMAAGVFATLWLLANNPLQIGNSLGMPVRSRAKYFRIGYQLAADHRARVWMEEDALVIGNDRMAFKILHARFFNPARVGQVLDILNIVLNIFPAVLPFVFLIVCKAVSYHVNVLRLLDFDVLYLLLLDSKGTTGNERWRRGLWTRS